MPARKWRLIGARAAFCALCAVCGGCRASEGPAPARDAPTDLRVPATQTYAVTGLAPGERRPVLIFLHGLGSSGQAAFDGLRLAELGARERIFVLAPDGDRDHQGRRFWNAGAACCNFDHSPIDDVGRLTRLIDTWRARPDVDPKRIYLAGHSNGGFMTERLVCALAGRVAAAASLAGAAPPAELPCAVPGSLALLEVHGDADPVVPYEGGSVFGSRELGAYPAIERGFREWGKRLRCAGEPEAAPALDLDPELAGAETLVQRYSACAAGSVSLWTVHGGAHFVGTRQPLFDAVWRFLAAH